MESWPKVQLGDVCAINPKIAPPNVDALISVVPMSAISETGEIDASNVQPFGDVSKGLTLFQENDVLFAKITPCMENGKGAIAVGLSGGIGAGSTEFFVLRPDCRRAISAWIYHFTKRDAFRRLAAERMTGSAGQRRVPRVFLERVPLPLPPLAEQARIAAELDAVVAQTQKRQTQLAELDALAEARFLELFGDPATNPKGWPTKPLAEILEINMGQSPPSTAYNERAEGLPFFQGNADFGDLYPNERVFCTRPTKIADVGELLISVRAPVGALNFTRTKCCVGRGLAALKPKSDCDLRFLFYALRRRRQELETRAVGSTFKAVNKTTLQEFPIFFPDVSRQRAFSAFVERIEALKTTVRAGIAETRTLFDALTARYFG